MTVPDPGLAYRPAPELGLRLAQARAQAAATWARTTELRQRTERLLAEAEAVKQITADARRERRSSPQDRERRQRSEYARLLARLETMPVIEQAKGIIMAQSRCGEAEAFDMLRRASQRSNVPVRDLAARMVAKAAGERGSPARLP
ncbi:MAG TPA: ANTAR domain-containing protein [Trebonia sp.]